MMHIMIDLETLGTTPGCPVLSIGAVAFNQAGVHPPTLHQIIRMPRDLDGASGATMLWWLGQSDAARNALIEGQESATFAYDALTMLDSWAEDMRRHHGEHKLCVWANGASFDFPIIEHHFAFWDVHVPWKFWEQRCFRTAKALRGADSVKPAFQGTAHNALADAQHQAEWLIAIDKLYDGALLSEPE